MPNKLNQLSGMPKMSAAFAGWFQSITLQVVTQTVGADHFVQQATKSVTFKGTIQPLSPKQIALKPEGQRAWTWLQIHCEGTNLTFQDNDIITYNGQNYKIMATRDYSLNNYIEYHAIQDYQG